LFFAGSSAASDFHARRHATAASFQRHAMPLPFRHYADVAHAIRLPLSPPFFADIFAMPLF
jgi:hypothetical protein